MPVFLGTIDLAYIYFLHGAGQIRHMLLMGWAGENIRAIKDDREVNRAIWRSERKIRHCGVIHEDLWPENVMWNRELNRALIIDFHRCTLDRRPMHRRHKSKKRLMRGGRIEIKASAGGVSIRLEGNTLSSYVEFTL